MTPAVEVSNVTMTYGGKVTALENISFDVQPGEFVSILGPSGCGKSTLLALASGLAFPTAGTVKIAGKKVEKPVTDIGIVFQTDVLLDWRRALGNILMQVEMRGLDPAQYRAQAIELLNHVGLAGFEDKYPFELSGGMRQRVALCRALIHKPPLLLMDEPFGALDALTREQMVYLLHRIWDETRKSVVFVTHDIQEAVFLADRVIVMTPRPGRIAEVLDVGLPRPRRAATKESPRFLSLVSHIRELFLKTGVLELP